MSIPIYVLAGFDRRKLRSNESALKYFVIGSFASALLLYGMALLYGATGSTSFEGIRAAFDPRAPMAMIGLGLVVVGFAFKISSVPFHQWTPDVYEGAPPRSPPSCPSPSRSPPSPLLAPDADWPLAFDPAAGASPTCSGRWRR